MPTQITYVDEEGTEHKAGRTDVMVYSPPMLGEIKILTDPSRCDLHADDPVDEGFIKSILATGGNIEPALGRRDSAGDYWLFEGRRRIGATRIINSNPEYWGQFTPEGVQPPPLPFQIKIVRCTVQEALRQAFHGNNHLPLSPLDLAHAANSFRERLGWTRERTAIEMDMKPAQVDALQRLLELPDRVQEALHRRKIRVGFAQKLFGHPVDAAVDAVARVEAGESPKEILAALREVTRAKRAKSGKTSRRSMSELRLALEKVADSKAAVGVVNRALGLLDFLDGTTDEAVRLILERS